MPKDIPRRGDIFWAKLPLTASQGSEQYGDRPVLVLSIDAINSSLPIAVVVPLSERLHKANNKYRIRIPESEKIQESGTAGCKGESLALTEQIRCISRDRLGDKRLARLTPSAVAAVESGVAYILGIPKP